MKNIFPTIFTAAILFGCSSNQNNPPAPVPAPTPPPSTTSTTDSEPVDKSGGAYANDLGPLFVIPESQVEKYSRAAQYGYQRLKFKCSQCHTTARPLNAQYLDVNNEIADRLRKNQPELFQDRFLLQIENEIWKRKIKQMAGKTGANISTEDAKAIYAFLLEYYQDRVGKNAEKAGEWMAHRRELLEQFKKDYPERYQLLYDK